VGAGLSTSDCASNVSGDGDGPASRRLPWLLLRVSLRAWARDTLSGVGCGVRHPRGRAGSQETAVGPCCSSAGRIKLYRPIEIFFVTMAH
jgi:hypothetical protein